MIPRFQPDVRDLAEPIPFGPQSVLEALDSCVESCGNADAIVGRGGRLTWSEVDEASRGVAGLLHELGVRPGDRVGCSLVNDVDIVVAFFAALRAGSIWVGINRALAPPEQRFLLDDCEASVFLSDGEGVARIGLESAECRALSIEDGTLGWRQAWTDGPRASTHCADPFAAAAIAYTSGTTGRPKGAVHAQRNLVLPSVVQRHRLGVESPQRIGQCLPLTILNIMVLGPIAAAVHRATFVALDRIDADGVEEWTRRERLDSLIIAPPTVRDLIQRNDIDGDVFAGVKQMAAGGAAFPAWYRDKWAERFGSRLQNGYGMTEAPTGVVSEDTRPPDGACGKASLQFTITIRDESGNILPEGEDGEICIEAAKSGPFANVYTPMIAYWGRPAATAEVLDAMLYRTGDVGRLDEEGWLYIADRRSDLILRGGANVYPAEVEQVLLRHPGVAACAVLGRPDVRLGEKVVAVYESVDGADIASDLNDLCFQNLARYKVPVAFLRIDVFPRNAMGKITKAALSDWVGAQESEQGSQSLPGEAQKEILKS